MALSQWLPRSRRGGGEYNIGNFTVPAGIDVCNIVLDVSPADFDNPSLSVTASVEISTDDAQTWVHQITVGWVGQSPPPGRSGTWYASVNGLAGMAGFLARVHFSTSGTFRWGLLGELA